MSTNGEVITGSDFKRMVMGAYSEFLLEYEGINELDRRLRPAHGAHPGTNILRTMGAAIMPIATTKDDSIGGLARRVGGTLYWEYGEHAVWGLTALWAPTRTR